MIKKYDIDNVTECELVKILLEYGTPINVIYHTLKVSDIATKIATALNKKGHKLDLSLIKRAGVLHDIVRETGKGHDIKGGELVMNVDERAGKIITEHMVHTFPTKIDEVNESDLVAIADRLTKQDSYVGLDERESEILSRKGRLQTIQDKIIKNFQEAKDFLKLIEEEIEIKIDDLLEDESTDKERMLSEKKKNKDYDLKIQIIKEVKKPGRYIGGEVNSIIKKNIESKLKFGFCFPDLYEIGMSFTGGQILYDAVNKEDELYMERLYMPDFDMIHKLGENKLSVFSVETFRPLDEFDCVGFTLQYELLYSNIIKMLMLSNLEIYREKRSDSDPIILAGGMGAFNPMPLADVIDVFNIGDGEEMLPELLLEIKKHKDGGKRKDEILSELAKIDGIFVPSVHMEGGKVKQGISISPQVISDFNEVRIPTKPIIPNIEIIHDRAVIEIARGCPRVCKFCQANKIYKPLRIRQKEKILDAIFSGDGILQNTGYDELSFLSLSTSDYPKFNELMSDIFLAIKDKDIAVSFPSLRLDSFDEEVVKKMLEYKNTGLTFAPEAGSERLRKYIGKDISDENIMEVMERIIKLGFRKLKLYFMIGLPSETEEDLDAIVTLAERIIKLSHEFLPKGKRNFTITVSSSNFVPKPHTPFQWVKMNSEEELYKKNYYLKDKFKHSKGIKYTFNDTRVSTLEGFFSRADSRAIKVVIEAVQAGAIFDAHGEHFKFSVWDEAIKKCGLSIDEYNNYNLDDELPWDFIQTEIDKKTLLADYKKDEVNE